MKKKLKNPLLWAICAEIIIVIAMGVLGFKITYNPNLDNNWDAISACAAWAGVLVSGLAFFATLAVLYQNHKTIELSKKDIQNAINLQMFDKMMEIANKLENNDYSITSMELLTLFGEDILNQVKDIKQLTNSKLSKENESKTYYELLHKEDYDWELENLSSMNDAPVEILNKANEQYEKYKVLTYQNDLDEIEYYDIEQINKELSEISSSISKKQKKLKKDVFEIIRNKFPLDQ